MDQQRSNTNNIILSFFIQQQHSTKHYLTIFHLLDQQRKIIVVHHQYILHVVSLYITLPSALQRLNLLTLDFLLRFYDAMQFDIDLIYLISKYPNK
uniref:Uncharacterized protein n=1 Tax=Glossina brevipalpis TaxID=37001 RepID=A0A1A9VZU3_9MUSC